MKYYLDTEFHEYSKQQKVCGIKVGKPIDTIELISLGIVSEDDREYYAICKDFDLKAAWNNEWLRENVLKLIWDELKDKQYNEGSQYGNHKPIWKDSEFTLKSLNRLINKYGKTREQIAEEIKAFTLQSFIGLKIADGFIEKPEFYAYYADYDWVVFCWLFGRMIDLPKGFPMFAFDLKQEFDRIELKREINFRNIQKGKENTNIPAMTKHIRLNKHIRYPKQTNEHNALADAKWNKQLHKFLKQL